MKGNRKGRTLGFPTANLSMDGGSEVPFGVYLSQAILESGERVWGISNVGIRPTLTNDSAATLETHLFCEPCDLYGQVLEVELFSFLRKERRFASPDALIAQIKSDLILAKQLIEQEKNV